MSIAQSMLPLEGGRKLRFANFVGGPNRPMVAALRDWLESPDADQCVIDGAAGVGKTHLLQASLAWWQGTGHPWRLVPLAAGALLPAPEELAGGLLAIDDLQCLHPEQALGVMRAIDAAREGRWRVLLATRLPVAELELPFEDLRSRLQWGASFTLRPLDEAGVARLLSLRAQELGILWPERNTEYLLRRVPRDARVMLQILEVAYARAIADGRQISVPLLTGLLQSAQFAAAVEQAGPKPEAGGEE